MATSEPSCTLSGGLVSGSATNTRLGAIAALLGVTAFTSEPACGVNDQWIADCDASYDALCYLLCLESPDPIGCLISSCGASCDPELTPTTQSCR